MALSHTRGVVVVCGADGAGCGMLGGNPKGGILPKGDEGRCACVLLPCITRTVALPDRTVLPLSVVAVAGAMVKVPVRLGCNIYDKVTDRDTEPFTNCMLCD